MKTPGVFISATGAYLPERVPAEWAVAQGFVGEFEARRYGIKSVTMAGDLPAPEMALRASRQALLRAGQDPAALSLVLYVSTWFQGPLGWCPQYYVQRHTGSGQATAAEIRQACMGMFCACELAAAHLMAAPEHAASLITSADNYSTQMIDRWRSSPHAPLGDGACALLFTRKPGFARLESINSVTLPQYEDRHRGSVPLFPPEVTLGAKLDLAKAKEQWQSTTGMDPREPVTTVTRTMLEVVDKTLREASLDMSEITRIAFVNWSEERVRERAAVPLGLPMSRLTWEYGRTIGHVGACDQVLSLDHLLVSGELKEGDNLLLLGTGTGANISCMAVRILHRPRWADVEHGS
ncbi:ketoacyl-ACP synthase III family protein [Cystobacter ferrugineus]|uniref:Crotonobetainyl-CoA--carnitine CoA-transferase n=1 Tax=Cystobacter ferrugineus TaxID=83449 RepID=A0A1L9B7H1_9BACT|nr:ketoacyl-ACP synthase III family protein [Cystobacter ferrugineus]OJH38202.1 crotonobetainyl-CoA--carnitine CoA-transferase [Cystobacter ferrugineus]